jgi:UDP-glucose 4-epimerase
VVQALAGLMERDDLYGEVFNIGSQSEITIRALASKVIDLVGSDAPVTYVPYEKAYEEGFEDMQRRVPDISKINSVLGWEPTRTLDQIVLDVRDQQLQASRLSAVAA